MGPLTCGTGGKPGVSGGQVCKSVRRAAGGMAGESKRRALPTQFTRWLTPTDCTW